MTVFRHSGLSGIVFVNPNKSKDSRQAGMTLKINIQFSEALRFLPQGSSRCQGPGQGKGTVPHSCKLVKRIFFPASSGMIPHLSIYTYDGSTDLQCLLAERHHLRWWMKASNYIVFSTSLQCSLPKAPKCRRQIWR